MFIPIRGICPKPNIKIELNLDDDERPSVLEEITIKSLLEVYEAYKKVCSGDASGTWAKISDIRSDFTKALEDGNIKVLSELLRNFFINKMSTGLVSRGLFASSKTPVKWEMDQFSRTVFEDVLTWQEYCRDVPIGVLQLPPIGNPYGLVINDTMVYADSCRHYFYAQNIYNLAKMLGPHPKILEVGGGYGGVAWYFGRMAQDNLPNCYINCDLLETLFIFYYFIQGSSISIFPQGYRPKVGWAIGSVIDDTATKDTDIILVPKEFKNNIRCGLEIIYSSNALSETSQAEVEEYMAIFYRNNPKIILYQGPEFYADTPGDLYGYEQIPEHKFPSNPNYIEISRTKSPWFSRGKGVRELVLIQKDLFS